MFGRSGMPKQLSPGLAGAKTGAFGAPAKVRPDKKKMAKKRGAGLPVQPPRGAF